MYVDNQQVYHKAFVPYEKSIKQYTSSKKSFFQRKGAVSLLLLFILFVFIGIVLSSSYEPFNPAIYDTFESYQAYNPALPRIENVLDTLSGIGNNMTITQFMEQTLIVGDWGIFDSIRTVMNVISRPFVFVFALITSLFDMVTGLLNAFVV